MKKKTYLGQAIGFYLTKLGWTQGQLSEKAGLSQPTISQLISTPTRINTKSLKDICHCWPSPEINLLILIEHLRDEIERAGHDAQTDIDMRPIRPHHLPRTQAEEDIAFLEAHLDNDGVSDTIHTVANLIRRAEGMEKNTHADRPAHAAESSGTYLSRKSQK